VLAEEVFTEAAVKGGREVRLLSAACSSGQEPYSASIAFDEFAARHPTAKLKLSVLGTDISPQMLRRASQGVYHERAVRRGLSDERLQRYFEKTQVGWRVRPEIARLVSFRSHNLLESLAPLGRFDVILCRNVLIYFSATLKKKILDRLAAQLVPDGYLFLGISESIVPRSERFEMIRRDAGVFYRRRY
jgi:chemotaxis protein methyltransferase CheR